MSDTIYRSCCGLVAGRITAEELKPRLGKGCTLEHKCEQDWKRPGSDEKVQRDGHRISGCQNPNQDTDWRAMDDRLRNTCEGRA